MACALTASAFIQQAVPHQTCVAVSFILLLVIGVYNLFQNGIKAYLRTKADYTKKMCIRDSFLNQGRNENRSIGTTLSLGWYVLSILPKEELDRIDPKILDQYYKKSEGGWEGR